MPERQFPNRGDSCFYVESGVLVQPAKFLYWTADNFYGWLRTPEGSEFPVERKYIWMADDLRKIFE